MPFQGDTGFNNPEAHWNDTIPYTNNLEALKKHAICLRLILLRNNPKKDGIAIPIRITYGDLISRSMRDSDPNLCL